MSNADISLQIQTLRQHIQLTAEQLAQPTDPADSAAGDTGLGALIYLGNHHDAVPRDLIIDPIMQGDEIRTWMLMKIHVANPMLATRIPSQEWLMEKLQCSRPIVSRHIQVLRALRWITLCAEVRGDDGRYRGVVYAQHDQPLGLAETLYLDEGYIDFLEQPTSGDVLKRLQSIKRSVLAHTDHLVMTQGESLTQATTRLEQIDARLKSHVSNDPLDTHLSCIAASVPPGSILNIYPGDANDKDDHHHVKNIDMDEDGEGDHVKNIDMDESEENHRVKGFYMDKTAQINHVKNIDMVKTGEKEANHHVKGFYMDERSSSSSSSINKKTTTTTPLTPQLNPNLQYPKVFNTNPRVRAYAGKKVAILPLDQQQFILDWMEDRINAGKKGTDKSVGNPLQYLEWVANKHLKGQLPEGSYGIREAIGDESMKNTTVQPNPDQVKEKNIRDWQENMRRLGFEVDPNTGQLVKAG